jgi:hypothetical protein
MSDDGRMTVRFKDLLPAIHAAASDAERDPSEWVRLQIKRILSKRGRLTQSNGLLSEPRGHGGAAGRRPAREVA